jgi:calcium-dependent protein kinase
MGAKCGRDFFAESPSSFRSSGQSSTVPSACQPLSCIVFRGHHDAKKDIQKVFDMRSAKPVGAGSFGQVRLATHWKTGVIRAVKTVKKCGPDTTKMMQNEVDVLKSVDHPHIIRLFETFEDKWRIHLVMEVCSGGELFDRIIDVGRFKEGEAAIVMKQILLAIHYMHARDLAHRDVKPENILFLNKSGIEENVTKLIDFGAACYCPPGSFKKTLVGTSFYMAPECSNGSYNGTCDLWSTGAIMYILLSGRSPFGNGSEMETMKRAREGKWSFKHECWGKVSDDAKGLISNMLVTSPPTRSTAEQALNHEWIQLKAPRAQDSNLPRNFMKRLQDFQSKNKLQRAVLAIVASELGEDVLQDMRKAFTAWDANCDGRLTAEELNAVFAKEHGAYAEFTRNTLDYTEFLAASLDRSDHLTEDALAAAFRHFDLDGDDYISLAELKAVLNLHDDGCLVKAFLKDADKDKDGKLNFKEFVTMMLEVPTPTPSVSSPCALQELNVGAPTRRRTRYPTINLVEGAIA